MSKKLVVEVYGTDNNGKDTVQNLKLPTKDDWKQNLVALNKKISKKFQTDEEYGLSINGSTVRFDDDEALANAMKDFDSDETPQFTIVDIDECGSDEGGRKIVIHYDDKKFTFSISENLADLDDEVYDELLDGVKSFFKIKGRLGKIYEDVGGKAIYIDDWDDLMESLEDKEDGEELDLYLEDKNAKKKVSKQSQPGSTKGRKNDKNSKNSKTSSENKKKNKRKSPKSRQCDDEKEINYDQDDEKNPSKPKPVPRHANRVKFPPGFHDIPCRRVRYASKMMRGSQKVISTGSNKIIMVVGQTGAGKTTFLNSMINYVYNVQFEDKYRLKLIIEQEKEGGQAVSQTDHVSAYFIKKPDGSNINYDLTVVDTPGFGDTRGIEQDKRIVKNIKLFFENVLDSIDAVCFVVKATDTRLTGPQKYIFNSVLNLWGKDIKENIFILMTFADAEDPPVLDAIKEQGTVADCQYFKLNNSVYKKDPRKMNTTNQQAMIFDKMFWDMGTMCFDSLFKGLNSVNTKSVTHSRQVLRERERITNQIELMSNELNVALEEQQELEKQKRWIKDHEEEINTYTEKPYYVNESYYVKEYRNSTIITTCRVCANRTCHPGCCVSDKEYCGAMGDGGYCTICNCHYSDHHNASYEWVKKSKQVRKSDWEDQPSKKDKYNKAQQKRSRSQQIIVNKENALKTKQQKVSGIIGLIHGCIAKLEKIALRPVVTTVGDYIDKLIDSEENNPQGRDAKKIKKLKEYKKQEAMIAKIEKSGKVTISELLKNDENDQ